MAASDVCIPKLYADSLTKRSDTAKSLLDHAVRNFAHLAAPLADALVIITAMVWIVGYSSGSAMPLLNRVLLGVMAAFAASWRVPARNPSASNLVWIRETERVLRSTVQLQFLLAGLMLLLGRRLPIWTYPVCLLTIMSFMLLIHRLLASVLRALHKAGYGASRAAIYGPLDAANRIASALLRCPSCAVHPAALIYNQALDPAEQLFRSAPDLSNSIPIYSGPLTSAKFAALGCDLLVVAGSYRSRPHELAKIQEIARAAGITVAVPSGTPDPDNSADTLAIDNQRFETDSRALAPTNHPPLKRMLDIAIASAVLTMSAPLLLLIAILIKLDSPGPVLFVQKRLGRDGQLFSIYKFRSMHISASPYEVSPTRSSDPRITLVGRILRRAGLDELPQLINVLRGQMSLVGPRPEMPFLVERHIEQHRPRLQATPGITGLWQLSDDRAFPIHRNTHYDLFYIRNRTCCMDVAILLHTLLFAMRRGV